LFYLDKAKLLGLERMAEKKRAERARFHRKSENAHAGTLDLRTGNSSRWRQHLGAFG
jgi:hypothetical protein